MKKYKPQKNMSDNNYKNIFQCQTKNIFRNV